MPGHASAAIAAYPQLGTEKQSIKVPTRFGVQYHAYNVADPKVIQFIKDVLDEVCNLFPSETIHIGGDEVKYDQWKKSAQVRNFIPAHHVLFFVFQVMGNGICEPYLEIGRCFYILFFHEITYLCRF